MTRKATVPIVLTSGLRYMVVILAVAPCCAAAEFSVPNAGFEEGQETTAAHWSWWSRTKSGTAERTRSECHGGVYSVCLRHDGDRDWCYSNDRRFEVRPGQTYLASAWVKVRAGQVALSAVALNRDKTLKWDIGSDGSKAGRWTRLEAFVEVPESCDRIYLRFGGNGIVTAWVDDVAFVPFQRQNRSKPKVLGYAAQRVRERMDRGLVAVRKGPAELYIGWRLLQNDPEDVAFNVYCRRGQEVHRVNEKPIRQTTDFVDNTACTPAADNATYFVRPVVNGKEGPASAEVGVVSAKDRGYVSIRLQGNYRVQKIGIGDLDGDGRYDYVVKQPADNIDPYEQYWKRSPDTYKLEAYDHDGKFLWRYDLGWAIEQGIWYSPYLVYDLDGDGKAEVAVKTGEGDPRGPDGRVQSGPEYLTILDGMTGRPITRVDWPSREPFDSYNYASRNQMCVAYLDGKTPCLIVERGTYNYITVVAYEYHNRHLRELWRWDNKREPRRYWGQGAHTMHAADIDGDGRDEIILGSAVLDDNGTALWSTGLGHPDSVYVGQIDPSLPGLQIYYNLETHNPRNGMCLVDARTGKILWGHDQPTIHIHSQGMCSPIDPTYPGCQCYGGERDFKEKRWLRDRKGNVISTRDMGGLAVHSAYWDADPHRRIIHGSRIAKYQGPALTPKLEGSFVAVADILGDWREEIVTTLPGELRIYTTTIPARDRRPCLMQDPIYRLDVVAATMGYYQVPMTSYDLAAQKQRAENGRRESP
ncbi:MAG: hypothetical protein ACLQNE_24910 [Thermoguttaceae bacterium]